MKVPRLDSFIGKSLVGTSGSTNFSDSNNSCNSFSTPSKSVSLNLPLSRLLIS